MPFQGRREVMVEIGLGGQQQLGWGVGSGEWADLARLAVTLSDVITASSTLISRAPIQKITMTILRSVISI
jgi:hypothetical protein